MARVYYAINLICLINLEKTKKKTENKINEFLKLNANEFGHCF